MGPKPKDSAQPYFPPEGGQGMLGRPAHFMEGAQRYPRGYTPDRLREMTAALADTRIRTGWSDPASGMTGQFDDRARVREALARSTVPAGDVRGLTSIETGATMSSSILGSYEHTQESFNPNTGRKHREPVANLEIGARMTEGVTLDEDLAGQHHGDVNRVGRTLIHEIGHHVQNQPYLDTGKAVKGRQALHVRLMGDPIHEAGAENYADRHFRPDPRFPDARSGSGYDDLLMDHWEQGPRRSSPNFEKKWTREYERNRNLSKEQFFPPRAPRTKAAKNGPGAGQMSFDQIEPEQGRLW